MPYSNDNDSTLNLQHEKKKKQSKEYALGPKKMTSLTYTNHGICCYSKKSGFLVHKLELCKQSGIIFHLLKLDNGTLQGWAMFAYKIIASL